MSTTRLIAGVVIWVLAVLAPSAATATNYFVDPAGNDGNTCLAAGAATACLTIQAAVNKASPNDTVIVAAGTYSELVTINKALTINGAQVGVDARGRAGSESVLDAAVASGGRTSFSVAASDVTIDGFTFKNTTNANVFGYAVWLNPGISTTVVRNNIFEDNIVGLGLGGSNITVFQNVFRNNNSNPTGAASGHGIYTDEFVGGTMANVTINENEFTGNATAGVGLSTTDPNRPMTNVVITNNAFDQNGRGLYMFLVNSSQVTGNTIENMTFSYAIGLFGVNGLTVTLNTFATGPNRGIRIDDLLLGPTPNAGVVITLNNFSGFPTAGLEVFAAGHTGTVLATCNWWDAVSGPTNPGNPGGTGNAVIGDAEFDPWLIGLAPDGECPIPPPVPTTLALRMAVATCSLDLRQDWVLRNTKLQYDVWNEEEVKFTGAFDCANSWHETSFAGDIDSAAQNFDADVLGTLSARYRVQAVQSTQCPGAQAAGLVGVQSTFLVPDVEAFASGSTLAAAGRFLGEILWDPSEAVPEGGIRER